MANITISVQSFLNAATNLSITIDNAQTVAQLKTAINSEEGTPTAIMDLFFNDTKLTDATTLAVSGLIAGSYVKTSNNLTEDGLWTKQERQEYKLELARLKRARDGNARSVYDITQLPTQYDDNSIIDNPNTGGLVVGRPWIAQSYSIGTIPTSINEGSAGTINVTTAGVADGTTLYWTIETHAEDFTTTSGSFTVTSNAGSFTVTPTADASTEGLETFTVAIRTGSTSGTIVATTSTIDINDTSLSYSAGLFRSQYSGWPNQNTANPTWFDGKTPVATTTSTDFSLTLTAAETSRAYQWLGYIKPDWTGTWTFTTSGVTIDDCLIIWIGSSALSGYTTGNAVANISLTSGSGTISLTAGTYYPIRVQFANNGGPGTNHLRWSRNGSTASTDFSSLVYYNSSTNGF